MLSRARNTYGRAKSLDKALVVAALASRTEEFKRMTRMQRMQEPLPLPFGTRHVKSLVARSQNNQFMCELDRWFGNSFFRLGLLSPLYPPNPRHPRSTLRS
jgi:hypothetical protein